MFIMDYTDTMRIISEKSLDAILNQIADAIYHGYDLASTTGNGDILPSDQLKWILMIP